MSSVSTVIDRFRLDGKVAVVTGASKNIGLEVVRAFAEAGATVVAVARGAERLERRMAALAKDTGGRIVSLVADVTDRASVEQLVDHVHAEFTQVDILVNNAYSAGNAYAAPVFEISDDDWEQTFLGNVLGPYRLCRGFGHRMIDGHGGSIINVLSGSGFLPTPGVMPYGSTKAALWMMTRYPRRRGRTQGARQRPLPRAHDERNRRTADEPANAVPARPSADGTSRAPDRRGTGSRLPRVRRRSIHDRRPAGRQRRTAVVTAVQSSSCLSPSR